MVQLADTHCHLDFRLFDEDRGEVISRCAAAGVTHMLNPGIDLESSRHAISIAEKHPHIFAAVGVHPNDGQIWDGETKNTLRKLAEHPKVVAIGEIGLDYYRDQTEKTLQQRIFREQLDLAGEMKLPVIVHSRQAGPDVLNILSRWREELAKEGSLLVNQPGVMHSFEGDLETALQVIEMGFYLGIGGPITFKNAPEKRALLAALPLDVILLETDSPFLAPHPHRGERNEPAYVRWVAEAISSLINTPLTTVARITSQNAARLFAWREIV